jgi:peptidoglycan-N-acetylmuramic acid deacetylase
MKSFLCATFLLILCICAGCKGQQIEEVYEVTVSSQTETEGWWMKRNKEHKTPEVSDKVDLSKYDAYYVDPKAKNKKCIYLTFDCGYEMVLHQRYWIF